jgi:trehalose-phosphatase
MIPADLAAAIRGLLASPRVLIGLDFDGVLAPLVNRREDARPMPGSMDAVRHLAGLTGVELALVSGRALDSLQETSGVGGSDQDLLTLVGSHGAERLLRRTLDAPAEPAGLTPEDEVRLGQVVAQLQDVIADGGDGLEVELKPTGAVLHTRQATSDVARRAEQRAVDGPGALPGVHVTLGKAVVEIAVIETSKGVALQQLRAITEPDGLLYVGDDVTDETAFAVLTPSDVGVKVGPGDTLAAYRLDGPDDVLELLQLLLAERSQR